MLETIEFAKTGDEIFPFVFMLAYNPEIDAWKDAPDFVTVVFELESTHLTSARSSLSAEPTIV